MQTGNISLPIVSSGKLTAVQESMGKQIPFTIADEGSELQVSYRANWGLAWLALNQQWPSMVTGPEEIFLYVKWLACSNLL